MTGRDATGLDEAVRVEIARQVDQALAERITPLKEALERIGAQMAEHNAAVEAAHAAEAGGFEAPDSTWFRPKGRAEQPAPDADLAPDSEAIAKQIQRFAELRLQDRISAVNKRCARIHHRMATHGAR